MRALLRKDAYDIYTGRKGQPNSIGHVRYSLTNSVIGQVVGNIVAGGRRPNNDDLLSYVFLRSSIFEEVNDLAFELFL